MSNLKGSYKGHKFCGDPKRFEVVAEFVFTNFGKNIRYIADVAGGQGMLTKVLNKKYNYESEVIDPRGYTLTGVNNRIEEYKADMADYYDLIVGLHPDQATTEVVKSAYIRPVLLIPCCNFWNKSKRLGTKALISDITAFYDKENIKYKVYALNFTGPKNIAILANY